jgi:hypothetical protein
MQAYLVPSLSFKHQPIISRVRQQLPAQIGDEALGVPINYEGSPLKISDLTMDILEVETH